MAKLCAFSRVGGGDSDVINGRWASARISASHVRHVSMNSLLALKWRGMLEVVRERLDSYDSGGRRKYRRGDNVPTNCSA